MTAILSLCVSSHSQIHTTNLTAYDVYILYFVYVRMYDQTLKAHWLREAPTDLTFNNFTLRPHYTYVFCIYRRTNSDLCHLYHKLIGFYKGDEKCLLRGTD
jgi:hypothetical protein